MPPWCVISLSLFFPPSFLLLPADLPAGVAGSIVVTVAMPLAACIFTMLFIAVTYVERLLPRWSALVLLSSVLTGISHATEASIRLLSMGLLSLIPLPREPHSIPDTLPCPDRSCDLAYRTARHTRFLRYYYYSFLSRSLRLVWLSTSAVFLLRYLCIWGGVSSTALGVCSAALAWVGVDLQQHASLYAGVTRGVMGSSLEAIYGGLPLSVRRALNPLSVFVVISALLSSSLWVRVLALACRRTRSKRTNRKEKGE